MKTVGSLYSETERNKVYYSELTNFEQEKLTSLLKTPTKTLKADTISCSTHLDNIKDTG